MGSSSRKSGRKSSPNTPVPRSSFSPAAIPPILQKSVADMSEHELLELVRLLRDWMGEKQQREAEYVRGRQIRQTAQYGQPLPTRTDRDYQRDQPYETRLIDLLETLLRNAGEAGEKP